MFMLLKKLQRCLSSEEYTVKIYSGRMGKNNLVNFYFISFFLILNTIFSNTLFSQSNITENNKTNYEILSDLLVKSLNKVEDRIIIAGKDKTYLLSFNRGNEGSVDVRESTDETKLFFQSLISQSLRDYKIITDSSINFDYRINIGYPGARVNYSKIKTFGLIGNKVVKRECRIMYKCTFTNKNADTSESFSISKTFGDEIFIDKIPLVEDNNFRFTRSSLPVESKFSKILIPAAIILSTAVAIILFFTIRK